MKLQSSNPLTGAIGVGIMLLLAAGIYVSKDSAWIIFFATLFCGGLGVLMSKATGKNVKGSAIIGAVIGLIAGIAFYAAV